MSEQNKISIGTWLDTLIAKGIYSFSIGDLAQQNPTYSHIAVKRSLSRLSAKGKIVSVHKGYYLILTPPYAARGVLPPELYLDAMMRHLQRPYYMALLSAAAFHGASHQQPQEYFVVTDFPVLRPTFKKGLRVNYVSTKMIPEPLLQKVKTEAGYLNVSNPVLTACDLIQFEKRIGGLSRAATVINELAEAINPADFTLAIFRSVHRATLQRLGYLLENISLNIELADALFEGLQHEKIDFYRILLKPGAQKKGFSSNNRWKVIANAEIEIDE